MHFLGVFKKNSVYILDSPKNLLVLFMFPQKNVFMLWIPPKNGVYVLDVVTVICVTKFLVYVCKTKTRPKNET